MKDDFVLKGGKELELILKELPANLEKRIRKAGLRKASARFRTLIRRDAPKGATGLLRKSIGVYLSKRAPIAWIGLNRKTPALGKKATSCVGVSFYYSVLDIDSARGKALAPWFEASVARHAPLVAQLLLESTEQALAVEAGKAYARSLRGR